jgi:hypothetical protein
VLCGVALPLAWAAAPAQATTQTFPYTDGEQMFVVPADVFGVKIVAIGGTGGAAGSVLGGEGAQVNGNFSVIPGHTLYIEVGGNGESEAEGGAGGFNGGGNGGGGGGGASDVRTSPRSTSLTVEDTRLIVAGGGGGAGASGGESGGAGGKAGENGGEATYPGGGKGTQTEGGEGVFGCVNSSGNGQLGLGGAGGYAGESTGPGGGGGGGLYGGAGGAGSCILGSSGGGGGSSLTDGLLTWTSAAPKVEITYYPPPSVSISSPENGATYQQGQAVSAIYSCTAGAGTTLKSCAGPVANGATFDTSTTGPHTFTVTGEDVEYGKAAQSVTYSVAAPPAPPTPTPPTPTPPIPNTVLGSHPKKTIKTKKKKVKVKFSFSSDVAGATFKCKLDQGAFAPCTSPKTYKVKLGKHTFSVEAVSGATDQTPATFSFKVKKKS